MVIGILKESHDERRVVMPPSIVQNLLKKNVTVLVEKNAGESSFFPDASYEDLAQVVDKKELVKKSDVLLSISTPEDEVLNNMREDQILLSVLNPLGSKDLMKNPDKQTDYLQS